MIICLTKLKSDFYVTKVKLNIFSVPFTDMFKSQSIFTGYPEIVYCHLLVSHEHQVGSGMQQTSTAGAQVSAELLYCDYYLTALQC